MVDVASPTVVHALAPYHFTWTGTLTFANGPRVLVSETDPVSVKVTPDCLAVTVVVVAMGTTSTVMAAAAFGRPTTRTR